MYLSASMRQVSVFLRALWIKHNDLGRVVAVYNLTSTLLLDAGNSTHCPVGACVASWTRG